MHFVLLWLVSVALALSTGGDNTPLHAAPGYGVSAGHHPPRWPHRNPSWGTSLLGPDAFISPNVPPYSPPPVAKV